MKLVLAGLGMLLLADPGDQGVPPPRIHVEGRVVGEAAGMRFGWPGVYFEKRVNGTGVIAEVEADADRLQLLVDGVEKAVFAGPGRIQLRIAGLPRGEHLVRIEKLAETQSGSSRLLMLEPLDGNELQLPPPRARQIEFIGDSHSVGYGDTSPRRACTRDEVRDNTNTQLAFGPVLARRLDADYRVIAYSGFGIVRNYAGSSPGQSLPAIYDRAIPGEPAAAGRDDRWQPQLVVINLGTNDFSTPLKPGEAWADDAALRKAWRERYVAFVRHLQASHPGARYLLMGADNFYADVEAVAATLAAGDTVTTLRTGPLELTGCDWHPSLADHAAMADRLQAAIEKLRIYIR